MNNLSESQILEIAKKSINKIKETNNPYKNLSFVEEIFEGVVSKPQSVDTDKINQIQQIFEDNPELSQVGTMEQYATYLDTIFPNSKVKDIVYHVNRTGTISPEDNRAFYSTSVGGWLEELEEMKGNRIPIILNITNPTIVDSYYEFSNKAKKFRDGGIGDEYVTPDEVRESGTDSVIGRDSGQGNDEKTYVTYSSNQVYQLGNKQDIERFKNWIKSEERQKTTYPSSNKIENDKNIIQDVKNILKENFTGKLNKNLFESVNLTPAHHLYNYLYENNLLSKYNLIAEYMNYPTGTNLKKKINEDYKIDPYQVPDEGQRAEEYGDYILNDLFKKDLKDVTELTYDNFNLILKKDFTTAKSQEQFKVYFEDDQSESIGIITLDYDKNNIVSGRYNIGGVTGSLNNRVNQVSRFTGF